jgi:hypothetical protein
LKGISRLRAVVEEEEVEEEEEEVSNAGDSSIWLELLIDRIDNLEGMWWGVDGWFGLDAPCPLLLLPPGAAAELPDTARRRVANSASNGDLSSPRE